MKYLLDTHAFLWLMREDARLSVKVKTIFLNEDNQIFLSIVSGWEMAIKSSLKKLDLPLPVAEYLASRCERYGIQLLNISLTHLAIAENLPFYHRDPFDRLIISQGNTENIPIITNDAQFVLYEGQFVW